MGSQSVLIGQSASLDFVKRTGGGLYLHGQRLRFMGANLWYGAFRVGHGTSNPDKDLGSANSKLNDTLDALLTATSGKANVIRMWWFQSQATTSGGVRDWGAFDHVVSVCAAKGFKLIITLLDQWAFTEGPTKLIGYYTSGYSSTVLTNNSTTYRAYVAEVAARYKDDPTIMAWELVNEGQPFDTFDSGSDTGTFTEANAYAAARDFTTDMISVIKGAGDSKHLIHHGFAWNGAAAKNYRTDYELLSAISGNDFWTYHDYASSQNDLTSGSAGGASGIGPRSVAAGMPLIIGETSRNIVTTFTLATRATYYSGTRFPAYETYGTYAGCLPWVWNNTGGVVDDNYDVAPGDPLLAVLGTNGMLKP